MASKEVMVMVVDSEDSTTILIDSAMVLDSVDMEVASEMDLVESEKWWNIATLESEKWWTS